MRLELTTPWFEARCAVHCATGTLDLQSQTENAVRADNASHVADDTRLCLEVNRTRLSIGVLPRSMLHCNRATPAVL